MSSSEAPTKNSSRKRKAPIDDNGEPVKLNKKKARPQVKNTTKSSATSKTATAAHHKTLAKNLIGSSSTQHQRKSPSVEIEDVIDEEDNPLSFPPRDPHHILESIYDDDGNNEDPPCSATSPTDMNTDDVSNKVTDNASEDGSEDGSEDEDAELG